VHSQFEFRYCCDGTIVFVGIEEGSIWVEPWSIFLVKSRWAGAFGEGDWDG